MGEKFKDLTAGGIITAIFLITHFLGVKGITEQFIIFFAVFFPGYALGRRVFHHVGTVTATALGAVIFLSFFSVVETAAFYFGFKLGKDVDFISLLIAMAASYALLTVLRDPVAEEPMPKPPGIYSVGDKFFLILASLATLGACVFALRSAALASTVDSIRTPWPLLEPGTLLALAVTWMGTLLILHLTGKTWPGYLAAGASLFSTLALTPLIYSIGFGFDGFLHVAAEKILLASGYLNPKPLYYIGQYVLTDWIARLLSLPVENIDRWLTPVTAAGLIPFTLYAVRRSYGGHFALAALFILPLSAFIATTPQSFAYVLGLGALILSLGVLGKSVHPVAPLTLAIWGIAVHPLAGIPLFFITLAITLVGRDTAHPVRRFIGYACALFSALAVPIMFYLLGLRGGTPISWDWSKTIAPQTWFEFLGAFNPYFSNHYALWAGWASLVATALAALLLACSIVHIVRTKGAERHIAIALALAAIMLFISSSVLKNVGEFSFLIDYERSNYADRLAILGSLALAVAAWPFISHLLEKSLKASAIPAAIFLTIFVFIAAAASYTALPRHDALTVGRGWSTGFSDLQAVRSIDRDADKIPYTVLSNQSVSAAAVHEFGFKRYAGDIFFYPIPTGGPLYEVFLNMTYRDPSRELAAEAGQLGQSKLVYVVLNDYWWNFDSTAEALSAAADAEWSIGDPDQGVGHVVKVYKFDLSKPAKPAAKTSGS